MYTDIQKRKHIYDLQRFLRRIEQENGNPAPLAPDGIFGPETEAAVRKFQQENGIRANGYINQQTWDKIYEQFFALQQQDALPSSVSFFQPDANHALSTGSNGSSVIVLQLLLNTAALHFPAFDRVAITGEYDKQTQDAVKKFQSLSHIEPTGVTNRATWDALSALHNAYFSQIPLDWRLAEQQNASP